MAGMSEIRLQLAVEQNDMRPPIGHKVSYTEH